MVSSDEYDNKYPLFDKCLGIDEGKGKCNSCLNLNNATQTSCAWVAEGGHYNLWGCCCGYMSPGVVYCDPTMCLVLAVDVPDNGIVLLNQTTSNVYSNVDECPVEFTSSGWFILLMIICGLCVAGCCYAIFKNQNGGSSSRPTAQAPLNSQWLKCTQCHGSGCIVGVNYESLRCPNCNGSGRF